MSKTAPLPIFTLQCEKYIAQCMLFNLDFHILYAGTQTGEILIYDLESNRLKNVKKANTLCILSLELFKSPNRLVSQNKTGEVQFWQIDGFELVLCYTLSTNEIGFCKLASYKTNMILCKGDKSTVSCFSTITYNKITVIDPQQNDDLGDIMVIKSIDSYVFCGYEANTIVVWKEDCIINMLNFPELECLIALDVDSNVTKGICAGSSNMINSFHIENDQLHFKKSIKITNPGVNTLQVRPDNKIVAAACWDHMVRLFSWKSMKLLVILDSHSTGVLNIVYSESRETFWKAKYILAIANKDNRITLWDVYN
ncbi:WD40/YVTN repeat-like-containing domain,WD40 repeat, conserved site,WD40 repeat,WD40-repeat-containing [Cinara cedri]|uniref:WD40/YVTN repeat-like-containing domain,WD40 repeat, conserved site,WD40 repeat,WD40-repeat-containing n=1 Tax=Cinara cedri TaxID=506608 RepID=A0A5E4NP27_9HEMI|nr:WD40/YVTN repeat-like-containing domain,WD40 repeat, conserved site,WD40 repeat,WD40-repeat-containing [Cinara cedri]